MSHIHLPDGVLPLWLWLSGYALDALLIGTAWRWGRVRTVPRRFALLGMFAAMMILVMLIELPPFSYHFNLSVVSGIILGPQLSVLTALIVNTILSLVGHGGITVIGLNSLVLSLEMVAGYYMFGLLRRLHARLGINGFLSTMIGLIVGTAAGFSIIALGRPWINEALQTASGHMKEELRHGIGGPHLSLGRLAILMFGFGSVGWILESLASSAILVQLARLYPGLLNAYTSGNANATGAMRIDSMARKQPLDESKSEE